jgi:hypothetical protein
MNRRDILSGVLTASIGTLAGCTEFLPPVRDTDGDGVKDRYDYAPQDPTVQDESEVLKIVNVDPDNPDAGAQVSSAENLIRQDPQRIHPIDQFIEITDITPTTLSVSNTNHIDQNASSVVGVLREYPRGELISVDDEIKPTGENKYSVESVFAEAGSVDSYTALYLQLYIQNEESNYEYVTESNPFTYESGTISKLPDSFFNRKEPYRSRFFKRSLVEGGYIIEYTGVYKNTDWGVKFFISNSMYSSRLETTRGRSRIEYARLISNIGLIGTLNAGIRSEARQKIPDLTTQDLIQMKINFVQSIPYVPDSIGSGFDDYSKFATETLVDLGGDCEDSTILLGSLLANQNQRVAFITFPGHIGIGIRGQYEGSTIQYQSEEYYYIETTSLGWQIGDIPGTLIDSGGVQVEQV